MWVRVSRADDRGFSLIATLLLIVMFGVLAAFGLGVAQQGVHSYARSNGRAVAFYAAEAGLMRAMDSWNPPGVVQPGASFLADEGTLPGGAAYRVKATLLDDASTVQALYAIRAEGTSRSGRTQEVSVLAATVPFGSPIRAALTSQGRVKVAGQADVNGWDSIPGPWQDDCTEPEDGVPGTMLTDTTKANSQGASRIDGNPPMDEDPDTAGWFNFGDATYEEVAGYADITFPGGSNVAGANPQPSYLADGSCNTDDDYNWGDPENEGACHDWFPVIHVTGDFRVEGGGAGQGVLLVDGNLSVCGGFTFYGPVVVRGAVKSCGSGFKLFGGVVTGEADINVSGGMVVGRTTIQYGACVVRRALSRSRAARPRLVTERPWFQSR